MALQSLESNPQLSFATRMEDWTSLGQHTGNQELPPESYLYLSDAFPNQAPNSDLTLELKVKVCTIKSEHPSPVVHSCTDLEQYT